MAIKVNYILNGSQINPPLNWKDTAFEVNFDRDGNAKTKIVSTNLDFVRENTTTIIDRVYDGATGGYGILEAMPLQVELERNGVIEKPFNGYIDLAKDAIFSRELCKVNATENKSIEWLEEKADGFTFEYLRSINVITNDDYKFIPYVINSVPDYKESAIAILTAYVVIQQIVESIEKVKNLLAEIANPITAISAVVKASLLALYLITLITSLIKLVKDIIQTLIQPVKYHACMSVKTLIEKGCQYLGLTLSSSILTTGIFSKAYIMPEKYQNPVNATDNRILGFTIAQKTQQEGYYKGTLGNLLRALKDQFNAKIYIKNNVLYFERLDFNLTPPQFVLPDIYQPEYKTNADEFKANYYLTYLTDTIDKNTLQEYNGTAYQVIFRPNIILNEDLVMMKGLEEVRLPFALAKRKTDLTVPEKIIKAFLDALSIIVNGLIAAMNALIQGINAIIGVINSVINALDFIGINVNFSVPTIQVISYLNLGNLIDNRLNMMKLETDFTSVPKMFLMDLGTQNKFNKLTTGNETFMSAEYLYQNFHYINNFLPTADKPNGNQYIIKEFNNVRFGFDQYQQVKENNQIIVGNNIGLIESFRWNPYDQIAYIRCRISTLLTNNINATYLIPSGK
jgi:hypothetical protein